MPDLDLAKGLHCHCTRRSWSFGGMECLFIGPSIVTKGTLVLPDSEDETSTVLEKVICQKTGIFNEM